MADRTPALRGLGRVYRPAYRDPKTRKQKTASIWWIEFWRDGYQHREYSKSRNASDARKLLKQRLGEVANGQFVVVGAVGDIHVSSDGTNWTTHSLGTNVSLLSVTYGSGKYVAVGASAIFTSASPAPALPVDSNTLL